MSSATENGYLNLSLWQYRSSPKFQATLFALTKPLLNVQEILNLVRIRYDLDKGIGNQLDKLGEWIGLNRSLESDLAGVFFSWDTPGLGWNQGIWKEPFVKDTTITKLDDETYRIFLKAKVVANAWDGTREGAYRVIDVIFADNPDVIMQIKDNYDLSFTITLKGSFFNALIKEIFKKNYLPLKPAGIAVKYDMED